ncbi:hypothetical protein [Streptomyces sp. NPDC049879]|uniref:hypothetical protein n=1 Tax=Streptomyces sp. NPDC049879 TaxID=3365598 RepID=UPI0037908ECD
MQLLPTIAAPGVAETAEALAEAACALHDVASSPASWSTAAADDAVEAMETAANALRTAHPAAAPAVTAVIRALARLRQDLGLPAADGISSPGRTTAPPFPGRRPGTRRGLGPGFQGVRPT